MEETFIQYLKEEDLTSFPSRLERIHWLVNAFGETQGYMGLPGGDLSLQFFEEARLCYLNGQFIACVILCQNLLEEIFRGLIRMAGTLHNDDLNKAGFATLTEEALTKGLITPSEAEEFQCLRGFRNKYVHLSPPSSVKWLPRRMIEEEKSLAELTRADAQEALITVFKIVKRPPFWI